MAPPLSAQSLRLYFIDVEGGQATLVVTGAGQSLLVDTGWPASMGAMPIGLRRPSRKQASSTLDYLVITHYHDDHVGGMEQLAARLKFRTVITHGPTTETGKMAVRLDADLSKRHGGQRREGNRRPPRRDDPVEGDRRQGARVES